MAERTIGAVTMVLSIDTGAWAILVLFTIRAGSIEVPMDVCQDIFFRGSSSSEVRDGSLTL